MSSEAKSSKATVNLFIDQEVLAELRKEAASSGVSLNSKINSILNKYVNFYRRTEETEHLSVEPRQWAVFLEMMDEKKPIEAMKSDGNANNIIAYFKHNNIPLTTDSLIKTVFENVAQWTGMCNKFRQYIDDQGYRHLIFDHRYGIKWSRIVSDVFSDLIKDTLGFPSEVSLLHNTFEIKILEREI